MDGWRNPEYPLPAVSHDACFQAPDYRHAKQVLLDYFPNFALEPISPDIVLEAAALRARQRLRTPDAIQIATGLRTGATLAVTNDEGWRNFPLIETLILSDLIE